MSVRGSEPAAGAGDRPALRHGGRLAWARAAFPDAPQPWLDLSTGVNPTPWRGERARLDDLRRLPDPDAVAALEAVAARAFGLAPEAVAAVPGAEAGLRLLPRLLGARRVAVASPTYGGHGEAWTAAGAEVVAIGRGAIAGAAAEAVVLVNPNNPDGAASPRGEVLDAARRLEAKGAWLIVDESFVEARPELSVSAHAGGRLVALRSFGKFYGLPGVRLGFVLADPALAARVRAALGDWPLCADALALGAGAYADPAWAERTRGRLARAASRLDGLLSASGFQVVGGTSLFRLARAAHAGVRFRRLAAQGVLTRPFDHDPELIRLGLPGPRFWPRLQTALEGSRP